MCQVQSLFHPLHLLLSRFNSLASRRCGGDSIGMIFKLIAHNSSLDIHPEIALRWMLDNLTDNSTLVQVFLNHRCRRTASRWCGSDSIGIIFKLVMHNNSLGIRSEITLRWMLDNLTNENSILVQVLLNHKLSTHCITYGPTSAELS